ncbi:MAG: tetratricopeptide repeat protein [Pseudomonadota bacterium]
MLKTARKIVIIISILVCSTSHVFAEDSKSNEKEIAARALKGQTAIFARQYDEAMQIFDALVRDYPDSPAGMFGKMAVNEIKMLEHENFYLEKPFLADSKKGLKIVSQVMRRYNPSTWDLFISGSVFGLDAFFKARKGTWWDAYTEGGESRQIFRRIKKMDPNYVDADFGLGMYLYWRSVFASDLWFLRMFPNRRDEGIAIVKYVAENGNFAKDLAKVNLAIMYFEEKRFDEAYVILDQYVAQYPNNVILRRLLGKVLISQKQYAKGVEQFETILKIDPDLKKPRYFIGAALVLARDPSQYDRAEKELKKFLEIQKGEYWPSYAHYWLGRLEEQRGNKEAAEKEYKIALSLNPKIQDAVKRVRGLGGGV